MIALIRRLLRIWRSPNSSFEVPRPEIADYVVKQYLVSSLQLLLEELVYLKGIKLHLVHYSPYREDARGGQGYFQVKVVIGFTTSSSTKMQWAFAHLDIVCDRPDYHWIPNRRGSYICINGERFHELCTDFRSGNIEIGVEGMGSHVPDDFRTAALKIRWDELRKEETPV